MCLKVPARRIVQLSEIVHYQPRIRARDDSASLLRACSRCGVSKARWDTQVLAIDDGRAGKAAVTCGRPSCLPKQGHFTRTHRDRFQNATMRKGNGLTVLRRVSQTPFIRPEAYRDSYRYCHHVATRHSKS